MDYDEKKLRKEIRDIEAELKKVGKGERQAKLADELLEAAYKGGRVAPEDIERYIWHWLDENPLQYPCLRDVYNNNEAKIVEAVRNHMFEYAKIGEERTIGASFQDLERLAARYMMGGSSGKLITIV